MAWTAHSVKDSIGMSLAWPSRILIISDEEVEMFNCGREEEGEVVETVLGSFVMSDASVKATEA
jgi:hypothetical protein